MWYLIWMFGLAFACMTTIAVGLWQERWGDDCEKEHRFGDSRIKEEENR